MWQHGGLSVAPPPYTNYWSPKNAWWPKIEIGDQNGDQIAFLVTKSIVLVTKFREIGDQNGYQKSRLLSKTETRANCLVTKMLSKNALCWANPELVTKIANCWPKWWPNLLFWWPKPDFGDQKSTLVTKEYQRFWEFMALVTRFPRIQLAPPPPLLGLPHKRRPRRCDTCVAMKSCKNHLKP